MAASSSTWAKSWCRDATSYLSAKPGWTPVLGTDLQLGTNPNPNITGKRTYTRAHLLYYAQWSRQAPTASWRRAGLARADDDNSAISGYGAVGRGYRHGPETLTSIRR